MATHFFRGAAAVCAMAALAAGLPTAGGQECSRSFWDYNGEVVTQLVSLEKNLGEWEAEVFARDTLSPRDAWTGLNLALRVGNSQHALAAVEQIPLGTKYGDYLGTHEPYAKFALKMKNPDVARLLYEKFPEMLANPEFPRAGLFPGWTEDAILEWLQARLETMKNRPNARRVILDRWQDLVYGQLVVVGQLEPMRERLMQEARQESADAETVLRFLQFLKRYPGNKPSPDLAWVVENRDYPRVVDWYRIAGALAALNCFAPQEQALLHALDGKMTAGEPDLIDWNFNAGLSLEGYQQHLDVCVRGELAECCRKLGKEEDAKRWEAEALELNQKYFPTNHWAAGKKERDKAPDQREVEKELREREKLAGSDIRYWNHRKEYYSALGNLEEEELALRKLLEIWKTTGNSWYLPSIYYKRLWEILKETGRKEKTAEQWFAEIASTPLDSKYMEMPMWWLLADYPDSVTPENPIFWQWLATCPKWERYHHMSLLSHLLEPREGVDLAPYDDLVEKLARAAIAENSDPSRAYQLAEVYEKARRNDRAIVMLELALEHWDSRKTLTGVGLPIVKLFGLYIETENLARAEEFYVRNAGELKSSGFRRLSEVARKHGATEVLERQEARIRNLSYVFEITEDTDITPLF